MTAPILEARGLAKAYGTGTRRAPAVVDASLTVHAGEVVLVEGPSGSGKTTLVSLLGLLLTPDAGEVRLDECVVSDLCERARSRTRRHAIGFVFQHFHLLPTLTAIENVELVARIAGSKRRVARERAVALLDALDLAPHAHALPGSLSGGERQRVALARALVHAPRVVLADEPTGSLDREAGRVVTERLARLAREQECGIVIVSHDPRIRAVADARYRMEDGRLAPVAGSSPVTPPGPDTPPHALAGTRNPKASDHPHSYK